MTQKETDELMGTVEAFTYDGDRVNHDHKSGEPERRGFVRGNDDPRDAALAEKHGFVYVMRYEEYRCACLQAYA